jgi:hypothetical protein
VSISPLGLVLAQRLGSTFLEVRFGTFADTVLVQVL